MINNQERRLAIYVEKSLDVLGRSSRVDVKSVLLLNSEVRNFFNIETLLRELNERLFENKGEIEPWSAYSIEPNKQDSRQSRFAKQFSARGNLSEVGSGIRLEIKKRDLPIKEDKKFFDKLIIDIDQIMDIKSGSYEFHIGGSLLWESEKRDYGGNWKLKPVFLKIVTEGRIISFNLNSVPPPAEISEVLLKQVEEVLVELSLRGILPEIKPVPVIPKIKTNLQS